MMPRSPTVLVVAAAALSAGTVLAAGILILGSPAPAGSGASATARIAPAGLGLSLPPDVEDAVILASAEAGPSDGLHLGAYLQAGIAPGFASAFALRPALSERDLPHRFEAGHAPPDVAAAAVADEDLPVIVVSRDVGPLPPRRPADLVAQEVSAADMMLVDVLPPARPSGSRLRFASVDPSASAVTEEVPAPTPPGPAPAQGQGLFGLLGGFAHPGAAPEAVGPGTGPAQAGLASWYGPGFHGRRTASGERFDQNDLTAAHRTLPFGTRVRVIDEETGRSIIVRINDRGPFKKGRIIDLSRGSALALGVASMRRVKVVSAGE